MPPIIFRKSRMTPRSEPAEPVQVGHSGERRERLAALLVIEPAQPAMALWIIVKVDAHSALPLNNGFAATRAIRPFRTAAATAARHRIESQNCPQKKCPNVTVSPWYRRGNTIF